MRWSPKNTWYWWKNLLNISRKHKYINCILPSLLAALTTFVLILKINIILVSVSLFLICLFNLFKTKFWVLYLVFFLMIFLAYTVYYLLIYQFDNYEINEKIKVYKIHKSFLIFKYKNLLFRIPKKIIKLNLDLNNNFEYFFKIKGTLKRINNLTLFNLSNEIFFDIKNLKINFDYQIQKLSLFSSKNGIVLEYLNIIVLNNYRSNSNVVNKLSNLNIIHFFTISGFHFNLIYLTVIKLFSKIKRKIFIEDFIGVGLLIIYLVAINFHISASRSLIFLILIFLNKNVFNRKLSNISLLSITALILSVYKPFSIFSYSFILSFLITLSIFIIVDFLKEKNYYLRSAFVLIVVHIYSTFLIHTFSEDYNIFSFFIQILLIPIVSFNYIFTLIFFKINFVIETNLLIFDAILNLLSEASYIIKFRIDWVYCFSFTSLLLFLNKIKLQPILG
ncbi:MAG0480 family ComEC-like protein [Mycoplasmopsis arginini]|uniref:MAG0480 family ComEC-like protein n=1 Tax=Mycoplasmopsis arginini TaxID=2094 RepID=UPI0002D16612|nr:Hypothetical protein, predicted ComEC/Rec2-related protein [Mycoplasmopsis arginini 7264]BAQ54241.1 hypothetical protein MARG145_0091 [Mycoplasmopsis arginini]